MGRFCWPKLRLWFANMSLCKKVVLLCFTTVILVMLFFGGVVLCIVGGVYTEGFAEEKEKEDTFRKGWCEPYEYHFNDATCCFRGTCWDCYYAYYYVFLYKRDPSQPSNTTPEITTTEPTTTTTTTQSEHVPLSEDYWGKISIFYDTVGSEEKAQEKMSKKHPIGEAGECWYDPGNEQKDARWNKPDSEFYLIIMVVCWGLLFLMLTPLFVVCGVGMCTACGLIACIVTKRVTGCSCCGEFGNSYSEDATNKQSNVWSLCCGWCRFGDLECQDSEL